MKEREFTAVYQQDGEWYVGWTEELPGALGQGRSIEEAREDLREAIVLLLEANRELAEAGRDGEICLRESLRVSVA
jgi:predicted RNase H-like HicB family nuclease